MWPERAMPEMPAGRDQQSPHVASIQAQRPAPMTTGTVVRLVTSFGSRWGRIRPLGDERELFFNDASLVTPAEFGALAEGAQVSFDEERDLANGTRAVRVSRSAAGR